MRRLHRDQDGIALITVILSTSVLLLLVLASTFYATGSLQLSRHDQDWNAALSAAEAGVDDYLYRVHADDNYINCAAPSWCGNTAFTNWVTMSGNLGNSGTGQFHYSIDTSTVSTTGTATLLATGRVRNATRTVQAVIKRRGFLDYLYFTDYETLDPALYTGIPFTPAVASTVCNKHWYEGRDSNCTIIYFGGFDTIKGPLHSNDTIWLNGNATFQGSFTTSWQDPAKLYWNYNGTKPSPSFQPGYPQYQSPLDMPPSNTKLKTQTDDSVGNAGCLYTGPTQITLNSNGTMNVTSPYTVKTNSNGKCGPGSNLQLPANGVVYVQNVPTLLTDPNYRATCPTSPKNPLGYPVSGDITTYGCFNGDAFVSGTLKGQLTIAAENNIDITADLNYNGGLGGTDLLGLIANNDVEMYHPVSSGSRGGYTNIGSVATTVNAAILSLNHSFRAQNYDKGSPLGTLTVNGAIAQSYRGIVATSNNGTVVTGYAKNYNYDSRLKYQSPPYFIDPVQAAWNVGVWAEVKNPAGLP